MGKFGGQGVRLVFHRFEALMIGDAEVGPFGSFGSPLSTQLRRRAYFGTEISNGSSSQSPPAVVTRHPIGRIHSIQKGGACIGKCLHDPVTLTVDDHRSGRDGVCDAIGPE